MIMWITGKMQRVRLLFDKRYQELSRLSRLPRYTPGSFDWGESKISFPDAASFVFMYKELFIGHIYKFKSDKKPPFIIDCGANIGMSVIYCKELFPEARIIAFEPEKKIFSYLEKNITALKLENVELINKAVWKEEGTIQFSNEGADASRISSLHAEDQFQSHYDVQAVRLSSYIDRTVDFLKLDIEGAEIEVIKEIEGKLKFVNHLFIEYHSFENAPQELDILLSILTRQHFHYYIDSPNRSISSPFVEKSSFYSFDFFLNIYAFKKAD
jgi:FkbM family methyltransferase